VNTYFVTGATGVVGSAITETLLASPDVRLKLLVRASSQADLQARLDDLVGFWGADRDRIAGRVEALAGDTSEPMFGLSPDVYARLAAECTHIVHSAGAVRMNLELEEARRSAVNAAKHVIDFADACTDAGRLQKVEFISTVGVGGRMPTSVPERWIKEPRRFHNTYEQSKAEAELLVEGAILRGLPVTVHRPSMVVGNSQTGKVIHFQVFYYLVEFLSGQRTFGLFPNPGTTKLDLVPADYVAAAVVWSSRQQQTTGRILHLCAGPQRAVAIEELLRVVRTAFKSVGITLPPAITVPANAFRAAVPIVRLFSPPRERRALSTLPIFLDYLKENQSFANAETEGILHRAGIPTPSPEDFVPNVLGYYLMGRATSEA
jgi:thioester reductase-like protein